MMKLTLAMSLFCMLTGTLSARILPLVSSMTVQAARATYLSFSPFDKPVVVSLAAGPSTAAGTGHGKTKFKKMGFRNRLALWITPKRLRTASVLEEGDIAAADRKARNSLIIGIAALACGVLPWTLFWVAFPLGIASIIMGSKAKKMGSKHVTGIGFGIAALVLASIWAVYILAYGMVGF